MMRTALVVGQGSIGIRHAQVLKELGLDVTIVSRHSKVGVGVYEDTKTALQDVMPDYVVVANETARHLEALDELAAQGFTGVVLVEKPLSIHAGVLPDYPFRSIHVGYNLRFHPALQALASQIANDNIISVQAYVGQYLPDWRPGTDYRASYSAKLSEGGGVLRDLSHELDYLSWLFGSWTRLTAIGGRFGGLEIDSDDCWSILMQTDQDILLTLQLNYLDRIARRQIIVIGASHSYRLDLVSAQLEVDGVSERFHVERNLTYREQHLAVIEERWEELCSLNEGIKVMATIDAIEESAHYGKWINR